MARDTRRGGHPLTRNLIEGNAGIILAADGDIAFYRRILRRDASISFTIRKDAFGVRSNPSRVPKRRAFRAYLVKNDS